MRSIPKRSLPTFSNKLRCNRVLPTALAVDVTARNDPTPVIFIGWLLIGIASFAIGCG